MMRKTLALLIGCAATAVLCSCGKEETTSVPLPPGRTGSQTRPAPTDKHVIALIPKGTTHEFWKSVHAGGVKAARQFGIPDPIWKGPLKENDREGQIKVIEDMINRQVTGIVLAPLDDTALRLPVADSVRAGIPVVIIDSGLKSDQYVSFVATDNYKGGQIGGQHMAKLLGGKGKLVMMRYQEGSASTHNREEGFLEAIAKSPDIEVISSNQYGGPGTEEAMRTGENLLPKLRQADGVFCPNESTTFGMLRVLQDNNLVGKVKFVGFDASKKLVDGLQAGQIHALVVQNPVKMGFLGVVTMLQHLKGEKVDKRIDTGVTLVTRENMDAPEVRELLHPDLDRWLK